MFFWTPSDFEGGPKNHVLEHHVEKNEKKVIHKRFQKKHEIYDEFLTKKWEHLVHCFPRWFGCVWLPGCFLASWSLARSFVAVVPCCSSLCLLGSSFAVLVGFASFCACWFTPGFLFRGGVSSNTPPAPCQQRLPLSLQSVRAKLPNGNSWPRCGNQSKAQVAFLKTRVVTIRVRLRA